MSVIPDSFVPTATGAAAPLSLTYHDERGKFAGIAFRNAVFGLFTLGTYRFWGKTHIRRHLWSHVSLAGEPFEYTGLAKELLFGFLIVLVFLVPLSAVSELANPLLLAIGGTWAVGAKNVAFGALIYWLLNLAIYRARRYRLTRTLWRGIRGAQTGSAISYAFKAFGYSLLTLVSLGVAYPLMRTQLYRFRMQNTWIGNTPFRFEGSAGPLVQRWLVAWLPVAVPIVLFFGSIVVDTLQKPDAAAVDIEFMIRLMGGSGPLLSILVPVFMVLYVWYRVSEFRYFAGQTFFGGLRFASELKARSIIWIYLSYWLANYGFLLVIVMAAGLVFASFIFQGRIAEFDSGITAAPAGQPDPLVLFLIGAPVFLVYLLVNSVLQVILVLRRLVMRICGTLTISGEIDFDAIEQSAFAAPGRGEGLADALDIGGV